MLKFNIDTRLKALSQDEYKGKLKELTKQLKISRTALHKWRNIKKNSSEDIKSEKLRIIARFFKCDMENLFTQEIEQLKLKPKPTTADKILRKQRLNIPKKNVNG